MRIALRNEYGGIDRTVDVAPGMVWEHAYPAEHRERFPATRNTVQVQMADGSWRYGTIVGPGRG